jgi:hypothetical protein
VLAVPLKPVPNQTVSFNADGAFWQVHIYQSISFMCADVSVNGNQIVTGVRCFGGIPLLPYGYMTAPGFGNFIFDSDADWTGFGSTSNLFYLEQSEFEQFELMMLLGVTGNS